MLAIGSIICGFIDITELQLIAFAIATAIGSIVCGICGFIEFTELQLQLLLPIAIAAAIGSIICGFIDLTELQLKKFKLTSCKTISSNLLRKRSFSIQSQYILLAFRIGKEVWKRICGRKSWKIYGKKFHFSDFSHQLFKFFK